MSDRLREMRDRLYAEQEEQLEKMERADTRRDVAERLERVKLVSDDAPETAHDRLSHALDESERGRCAIVDLDLWNAARAALLRSEGREPDTAVEEAWDHATNVAMTVVEEYKRGEVSEAIMRGTLRNAPMYVESRLRLLGTPSDSPEP